MSRTLGLIALTGAMVMLTGVGSAEACNEPTLSLYKSSAGAGENVPFDADGLEPGHEYVLTVWEREVSRGIAGPHGTATGAFRMPDLGARDRDVYVKLGATHEGSGYPDSHKIVFKGPAPPASDPGASNEPPASNGPPTDPSPTPPGAETGSAGDGDTAPPRTEAPPIAIGPGLDLVGSKPIGGSRPSDNVIRATAERGASPMAGDGYTRAGTDGGAFVGAPVGGGPDAAEGVRTNTATGRDRPLFEGSKPAAAPGESSTGARSGTGTPATEAKPSERSATGDLWSGLAAADGRSLLPTLDVSSPAPGGGAGSLLAVGLRLLGGGLATLSAGLAVAAVRRRRIFALGGDRSRG